MSPTLVEELSGKNSAFKAMIHRRDDGLLQITVWKWTHEVVPGYGEVCEPFWENITDGLSVTDTVESARDIAREELRQHP